MVLIAGAQAGDHGSAAHVGAEVVAIVALGAGVVLEAELAVGNVALVGQAVGCSQGEEGQASLALSVGVAEHAALDLAGG